MLTLLSAHKTKVSTPLLCCWFGIKWISVTQTSSLWSLQNKVILDCFPESSLPPFLRHLCSPLAFRLYAHNIYASTSINGQRVQITNTRGFSSTTTKSHQRSPVSRMYLHLWANYAIRLPYNLASDNSWSNGYSSKSSFLTTVCHMQVIRSVKQSSIRYATKTKRLKCSMLLIQLMVKEKMQFSLILPVSLQAKSRQCNASRKMNGGEVVFKPDQINGAIWFVREDDFLSCWSLAHFYMEIQIPRFRSFFIDLLETSWLLTIWKQLVR